MARLVGIAASSRASLVIARCDAAASLVAASRRAIRLASARPTGSSCDLRAALTVAAPIRLRIPVGVTIASWDNLTN